MRKELFKEYAELKIEEKKVKARVEELNPIIRKEILDMGLDKLPTSLGNFNIKKVKRWTYTPAVNEAKQRLDELKAAEEATGTATFVEVEQLEFRETKDNESGN